MLTTESQIKRTSENLEVNPKSANLRSIMVGIKCVINLKMFITEQLRICPKQTDISTLSFNAFGIIKHLMDRSSPKIRFVMQTRLMLDEAIAPSNMSTACKKKFNVSLRSVQHECNVSQYQ